MFGPPSETRSRAQLTLLGLGVIVAVAALTWIAISFDWVALGAVLAKAHLRTFPGLTTPLILAFWASRAARWAWLLRQLPSRAPFATLYLITAVTLGLGIVTPFQSAELLKVEWLRKACPDLPRPELYATLLAERLLDFLALLILVAAASLLIFPAIIPEQLAYALVAVGVGGAAAATIVVFRVSWRGRLAALNNLAQALRDLIRSPATFSGALAWTLVSWLLIASHWDLALRSVNIALPPLESLSVMGAVSAIGLLSIVPGGIGLGDASAAALLEALEVSEAQAQAGAVMLRALSLLLVLLGLVHLPLARRFVRAPEGGAPSPDAGNGGDPAMPS